MPTYSYRCDKCGYEFDAFQSIKEEPLTICPVCSGSIHRMINGGSGFIFKGSGFYTTDYKNKSIVSGNGKKEHSTEKKTDDSAEKKGNQSNSPDDK